MLDSCRDQVCDYNSEVLWIYGVSVYVVLIQEYDVDL